MLANGTTLAYRTSGFFTKEMIQNMDKNLK